MKKATTKNKGAQGCMKISSFFSKKEQPSILKPKGTPDTTENVILVDSGDEESESLIHFKPDFKNNKRKLEQETGISPPMKKPVNGNLDFLQPSVSSSSTTQFLTVKTPEKLLTSAALKEYYSPTIKKEQTPRKKTPSPKKSVKHSSPCKTSASKKLSATQSASPKKGRKTPRKLFEHSPGNISEFNVEVLKNFVKITPTKKEVESPNDRQTLARKSLEIQLENEKTPVKGLMPGTSSLSPISKVRTKLDFAGCSTDVVETHNELPEKENHDSNNTSFNFDDSWEDEFIEQMDCNLDLSQPQHCKVVNIVQHLKETIITVKSTETNEQAVCSLQGFWLHMKLSKGDTVRVKANKTSENWLIDNQQGFVVFEPDLLISTTSVVNSIFCKRRSVLKERFRGFDPTNKYMIVGSMVHSLLQDVLRYKIYKKADIENYASKMLKAEEWTRQIYESGEPLAVIREEFLNYIPHIEDFVKMYVLAQKENPKKDNWKGTISGIEDIEENIWCPNLGVKGKVDVSIKNKLSVMPLEVKTGRASVSLEHRGQVLLYIMMMTNLGYRVSSGLLLYLKEGILKEISPSESEKRDIIILRNELAYYLSQAPKVIKTQEGLFLEPAELPEPIDHPSCSKCPYGAICMAYSKYSNEDISSKRSLMQVHQELNNVLTKVHIDYFMRWASLLSIELPERNGTKDLRDIYTLPPEERKQKGKCLINLTVKKIAQECNGTYSTTFEQQCSDTIVNFLLSGFVENTYVVISVKTRPAIATGLVASISMGSITVSLDRDLDKKYSKEIFFIDSYDSTAFLTYNLSSLALLLDLTERSSQLRSIIIDRRPATFKPKLPRAIAEKARPILKRLNRVQQRAVLKAIAANEYLLIKGMPGTGKTATIVALVQLLVEMNKTILITSHTHSAVDTVCLKLIQFGVKFMRLGSEARMDANLRNYSERRLTKDCTDPEALEAVYNSVPILAVTCLGSGHTLLSKRTMDVCIVDESTQVLQCSVFRPLYAAKTFILIGDPDQLPAVVRNKTALELGMNESLFERLDSDECRISLNLNYRMNEPITALANVLTYKGELQIGSDRVAKACLSIPNHKDLVKAHSGQSWLIKALDVKLENAVQFIDTGSVWNLNKIVNWAQVEAYNSENSQEAQHSTNIYEAAIIYHLVRALVDEGGVSSRHIGVIATYKNQVALLNHILKFCNVSVNTVDQFQGKDNDIIIYSCSKSKDLSKEWVENKFDITEDKRRLNVAITRAKHKLIIVGDLATLQNYSTFKKIKGSLEKNIIKLSDCDKFEWDSALDLNLKGVLE